MLVATGAGGGGVAECGAGLGAGLGGGPRSLYIVGTMHRACSSMPAAAKRNYSCQDRAEYTVFLLVETPV